MGVKFIDLLSDNLIEGYDSCKNAKLETLKIRQLSYMLTA